MNRTFKYRIYPNKTATRNLNELLFCHKELYNTALEQRITAWKESELSLTAFNQNKSLNQVRKIKYPAVNCSSFQQTMRRLDMAFKSFFNRQKKGLAKGFPRFKPVSRFNTINFINDDGCRIKNDKLVLTNIPPIRIKWHRYIPKQSVIKQFRITRKNKKWYVCLSLELADQDIPASTNPAVGVDLGLLHLIATSDGKFFDSPRYYTAGQVKLRVLQRAVSRKVKGSKSRRRAVKILADHHEHVANQGLDFQHKLSRHLVDSYGAIVFEDLKLGFMTKNKHLAKSTHDVAIGQLVSMTEYKAENAGVQVIFVDPKFTSQVCSQCGQIVKKSLSVRVHRCDCGLVLDRDQNAAKNVLHRGASLLDSPTYQVADCVESQAACFS